MLTYSEAIAYLDGLINYEKITRFRYNSSIFNLARTSRLLELLSNPQDRLKFVHIAGTKGKGSTAAMIASIIKSASYKVGLYTSPHLVSFRERIRINDELIAKSEVQDMVELVRARVDEYMCKPSYGKLTFFEVYTALALTYFALKRVDFAVLEVGMGGRLDATNVITPLVSVITHISYDHMDKLGTTLDLIAYEKAGIIKKGGLVVTEPQHTEALKVIENICSNRSAKLVTVGKDIFYELIDSSPDGQLFNIRGLRDRAYERLYLPLLGQHQLVNATAAVAAMALLGHCEGRSDFTSDATIRSGLESVSWPGRLEVVAKNPTIVLDCAHNGASAHCLRRALNQLFSYNRLFFVLGISTNKDIVGIGNELCPIASEVILTQASNPRAATPELLKRKLAEFEAKLVTIASADAAMEYAKSHATPADLICVTGSVFLVGQVRDLVGLGGEHQIEKAFI